MDSIFPVSIIDASAKLLAVIIEKWTSSDQKDKKVERWLKKHYKSLSDELTNDSVHLLIHVEHGEGLTIRNARKIIYPSLKLPPPKVKLFEKEFHYRLEYLVRLGLLQFERGVKEYYITRLGVAFLAMARAKGHYETVLGAR